MATKSRLTFPRRSLLFIPGDSRRKIEKGLGLAADSIILDLEDAVAFSQKAVARALVVEVLQTADFGRSERLVRLNPAGTELFAADLTAVAAARPDGLVLPKVEQPEQLQAVDDQLTRIEAEQGWPAGSIGLLALIETALGVMNLREIAQAAGRLAALIFGGEDLAASLGAVRSARGQELFYGRSAVVTAAAAYGLQAIDTVYVDFRDPAGLQQEAATARQLGFSGKLAIHPAQIEVIHAAFSPTTAEIEQAQALLAAYQRHLAAGQGVFVIDGRMVDRPMIRAAEQVLARANLSAE